MTFKRFEEILKIKYPEASACAHGQFGGTERSNEVEINFTPRGKCYTYYGSYQSILNRVGIPCISKSDIVDTKNRIEYLKETNGRPNPFSLFRKTPIDNSKEIEELEDFLDDVDAGKYIIV